MLTEMSRPREWGREVREYLEICENKRLAEETKYQYRIILEDIWMNDDPAYKLYICTSCKKAISYDPAVIKLMDFLGELSDVDRIFLAMLDVPIGRVLQGVLHKNSSKIKIIHQSQKETVLNDRVNKSAENTGLEGCPTHF